MLLIPPEWNSTRCQTGCLWTRDEAKGLAVCSWLLWKNPSVTLPFNGPLVLPMRVPLFLEEKTSNKYLSRAYYLISFIIIPEIFYKHKRLIEVKVCQ